VDQTFACQPLPLKEPGSDQCSNACGLFLRKKTARLSYATIRQALPGAIFFSFGWIIVTKLFQLYVEKYNRYNPTYLALASIIMLLTWMYLTCLFLLLGGKLNVILRQERQRERGEVVPVSAQTAQPA